MAEYPTDKPSSAASVGWRTSATPSYGATDPGAASRANGWAVDEVPGSQEFNWIQELIGDLLIWLQGNVVRCFTTLKEGIDDCAVRECFRVIPPASGDLITRLGVAYTATGTATGGGNPSALCCDGGQIYYIAGATDYYIVAADPDDGSEIWEVDALSAQLTALCCDGVRVYYVSDAANPGLFSRVRADGGSVANAGATYGHSLLVTNGEHVVGINGSTAVGDADIWVASSLALVATKSTGSAGVGLIGAAIDFDTCYVGGTRNGGIDVWAYLTSTGAAAWTAALDANAPTVRCIAADGRFVYVGTDNFALAAGGSSNLFVLDRADGSVLWSGQAVGATNILQLATDGANLYAVTSAHVLVQIPLPIVGPTTGAASGRAGMAEARTGVDSGCAICTDGYQIYTRDQGTPTDLRGITVGGGPRAYIRVNGDDPERRPFHTLAIPLADRT